MDEWLKIIGALGGLEAIRFTVTFLANRKTNARKEKATADSMELQNLLSIIDNLNKQIERYDERINPMFLIYQSLHFGLLTTA